MNLHQLEARYDGHIPRELREAAIAALLRQPPLKEIAQTKIVNVVRRASLVLPRMAETIRELLHAQGDNAGAVTEQDLIARGFTPSEIAAYAASAHQMAVAA